MNASLSTLDPANLVAFVFIGMLLLSIPIFAMRARKPSLTQGEGLPRDMEGLLSDIHRGIKSLSSHARAGSQFSRGKQAEVSRQLSELQFRMRQLETGPFSRYEARAGRLLADAARVGIMVPPP